NTEGVTSGKQRLISLGRDDEASGVWMHLYGDYRVGAGFGDGSEIREIYTSQQLSLNTWHHVAAVIKDKDDVKIYIDGQQAGVTFSGDAEILWYPTDPAIDSYIGKVEAFTTQILKGKIDEVQVFDKALTDAQIYALYKSTSGNLIDYDAAGNLVSDKDGYLYTYDYENRITRVEKGDGDDTPTVVAEFVYDALGRRIAKTDSIASTTRYYYYNDKWQVLDEYYDGTPFINHYVYGNYIDETLMMVNNVFGGDDLFYVHDHLYSPVALISGDMELLLERYEYDAYGNVHVMGNNFNADADNQSNYDNEYTLTGRRLDTLDDGDLRIMYYRNRYYSPQTGRFLTHDPLGTIPDGGEFNAFYIPEQYKDGMNTYQYVLSNPNISVDPYGLVSVRELFEFNPDVPYSEKECNAYCMTQAMGLGSTADFSDEILDNLVDNTVDSVIDGIVDSLASAARACAKSSELGLCYQNCQGGYNPVVNTLWVDPWGQDAGVDDHLPITFVFLTLLAIKCACYVKRRIIYMQC
ncbi:MAG TPA: hypothetical protein ENK70_06545, partial [Methylophaga sp.]|nr:hypothetical protein [Methylophaga sp.]